MSIDVDYYNLEDLLGQEERLVRDVARRFIDDEFMPRIQLCFREGRFPTELIPRLGELGFLGMTLPIEYGCAGLNNIAYGLVSQELERGDSGLRSFASVQSSLVMYPIFQFGSDAQKKFWLPRLATAEAVGCFGLTEPDFGSNPGGMLTRARRERGGYVLDGTKRWITNGSISDLAVVWAKLEEDGTDVIRGFLVEKERAGFTRRDIPGKFSFRASVTSELIFEDCWIPEDNLLPKTGGLKSPLMCLTQARYGIAWGALGAAMACYEAALEYAQNRVMFSRPIGGYQLVQAKLVTMITEITKGQLLAHRLGTLKDAGTMRPQQVSMAKMNNVSTALHIARLARDILGGNGITDDYPVIRHLLNLETVNTYEGTEDIHRLTIGRDVTGLSAFE
jgi:glutaryl-CoA dehydrogenase